jgi:uncharacterized protein
MEILFQNQNELLKSIHNQFFRYLSSHLPWKERFLAIKGLRGVGKTTLLLQHLKYTLKDTTKNLYVSYYCCR